MSPQVERQEPELQGLTPQYFQRSFNQREEQLQEALKALYMQNEEKREDLLPAVRQHYELCGYVALLAGIETPTHLMSEAEEVLGIVVSEE